MKKIFITAGHHLKDSGAVANNLKENVLTMDLRDLIVKRIKELDPSVKIWTDNDNNTLSQVLSKIKEVATDEDLLVDIHFNSFNSKSTGSEVLVSNNARKLSKDLAKECSEVISSVLVINNRGVKKESESARGSLGIFRTKASTILLEVAFISNPSDMKKYEDRKHWLAEDLAITFIRYYNSK